MNGLGLACVSKNVYSGSLLAQARERSRTRTHVARVVVCSLASLLQAPDFGRAQTGFGLRLDQPARPSAQALIRP